MTNDQIKEIALANGFKLKEQPSGAMDLNPYVYEFARALVILKLDEAANDIYALDKFVNSPEEHNIWISCMGRVDDILNDVKGVTDD